MLKKIEIKNYRDTFEKTNKEAQKQIAELGKKGYEITYFNIDVVNYTHPQYKIKASYDDGEEG